MPKVLLVGFGQLAHLLARSLVNKHFQVTGLKRTPIQNSAIEMRYLDLQKPEQLSTLSTEFDYVVITLTPDEMTLQGYRQGYFSNVENLLNHFHNHDSKPCFIYVSSTRVYGQHQGEWIDETSETKPQSDKGHVLLDTEKLIQSTDGGIIVRFSGIYGGQRQRFFDRVKAGIELQQTPPLYSNRIHQVDCAGVLEFLIIQHSKGNLDDSLFLASDTSPAPIYEVAEWLAGTYHCPMPKALIKPPNTDQGKRCNSAKLQDMGYVFRYPSYKQGYAPQTNE